MILTNNSRLKNYEKSNTFWCIRCIWTTVTRCPVWGMCHMYNCDTTPLLTTLFTNFLLNLVSCQSSIKSFASVSCLTIQPRIGSYTRIFKVQISMRLMRMLDLVTEQRNIVVFEGITPSALLLHHWYGIKEDLES